MAETTPSIRKPVALLAGTGVVLLCSGIASLERGTWWMEMAPILIGVPVLVGTFRAFRLSALL